MADFAVDFTKSYARRRPDEPRSHYSSRLKFINAMIKGEGDNVTDERIEVLSHCYSNVKYLSNIYGPEIMDCLRTYDPEIARMHENLDPAEEAETEPPAKRAREE
mmetsp:Transcript_79826/g.158135  ORF Transcript_79826/g.158135 Transcript_79826/m.158135 type:complete len:105 (+) Transcript_79826:48-362(+)